MWHSTLLLVLFSCVCVAQSPSNSSTSLIVTSSSGSVDDVYNICPVVIEFTEEQDNLSDDELKANAADAAMSAYLLSHPNNTLWDYFKIERKQKKAMRKSLPLKERVKNAITGFVDYTLDTAIHLAQTLADAIEWIINTIRDPLVGAKQVTNFFKEFGKNIKSLWGLMKEDPKETAENMAGGLLLHITHHPSEFTAETVLMIGTGFAVIGGLMHGVEAIFGTMSNVISNVLLSVLMFIHAIDDPIYIVTPLVTSIVDTAGKLTANNTADSTVLTIDAIEPLETCQIPEEFRPVFSTRDLCLSSPKQVRQLIFGTYKRAAKMTQEERIAAYHRFHDFVCCYLEDQEFEVNAPKMDATAFEPDLVATPVKMQNCSQLMGNYSAATAWKSSTTESSEVESDYDSVVAKITLRRE
ncbi:hypothetical protein F441_03938 [Phytophthora nicotianae CJ01A1]|uniref:Uncharacterized protein n=5 Tax=Phytophthora nicotianae TaxID=4792 RepID=V9FPP7_PHYNI|nr:hypothetical protein F443_03957 [Phytophthora nicotianae P1569]ETK92882.1 hypothetical protein L915_03848 [Phytophthora nicotianae]ETO81742.1 hypothetical protein F444_04014 [Phytophthora nicotianae P1976]ETP22855.1 hypothetical protein F441_03938 [Phytophthora nicotianae CJ01A1]ETP50835.1 hypothetical protein F442_03943 [Phytophthora nicotianae P10297]KUF96715.1 hypothetical protein AM587_10006458 [Phytophthora nicotianae]